MSRGGWKVHLQKEQFKFSSTHMTLFPDGRKEALHGHNYQVSLTVELSDTSFARMIDFSVFKQILKTLCDHWDERVLMPGKNRFLTQNKNEETSEIEFRFDKKRYVFPLDEVVVLELDNISSEQLSFELAKRLWNSFQDSPSLNPEQRECIEALEVRVDETRGQGASYRHERTSSGDKK